MPNVPLAPGRLMSTIDPPNADDSAERADDAETSDAFDHLVEAKFP